MSRASNFNDTIAGFFELDEFEDSYQEDNGLALRLVSAEDIIINKLNEGRQNQENIDNLTASIAEAGLITPLSVRMDEQGQYILLSGEGRFKALKNLNFTYRFNGKDIIGKVPVIINNDARSEDEEEIFLIRANAQRQLSIEEKIELVKRCAAFYEKHHSRKSSSVVRGTKRDWISSVTGFSPASVQHYLNGYATLKTQDDIPDLPRNDSVVDKMRKASNTLSKLTTRKVSYDDEEMEDAIAVFDNLKASVQDMANAFNLPQKQVWLDFKEHLPRIKGDYLVQYTDANGNTKYKVLYWDSDLATFTDCPFKINCWYMFPYVGE